ncbi:MAG: ParB/RepB/Spo0J family partition protein [Patescibacteria group bacterium]
MTKKLFGLGKGLGSLIPASVTSNAVNDKENIFYVEVGKIRSNPDQPRKDFDKDTLAELATSIRKYGILQPLLVAKMEDRTPRGMDVFYQLIAGERRLRAAQLAGLPHVPVIIRDDIDDGKSQRLEMALIENLQREDLNALEEAQAYDRLQGEFGLTQKDIAIKVAKSREAVANSLRLLKLPNYIRDALRDGRITASHARALLAFDNQAKQKEVYEQILKGGFSSKDTERTASRAKPTGAGKPDRRFEELEQNLTGKLKVPVLIRAGGTGGTIAIKFANLEELNTVAKNIID